MKTSCFALLLLVCCSDAQPHGTKFNVAPGNCCFNLSSRALPGRAVAGVQKSHRSCKSAAFIVTTVRGRQICYSQRFPWAQKIFSQHEGSAQ